MGIGGSGKRSLARLAAYVAERRVFSVEVGGSYRRAEFREDLRKLFSQVSVCA